jgi:DNA adenine methylase
MANSTHKCNTSNADNFFINDKSDELIALYNAITFKDKNFFSVVDEIMHNWQLLTLNVVSNIPLNSSLCFNTNEVTQFLTVA